MIGAGGLLYLLEQGVDIPGQIGLAGFNNVELAAGPAAQIGDDGCLPSGDRTSGGADHR